MERRSAVVEGWVAVCTRRRDSTEDRESTESVVGADDDSLLPVVASLFEGTSSSSAERDVSGWDS